MITVTRHAQERFDERLPGEDFAELYSRARRTNKRLRKVIRQGCPVTGPTTKPNLGKYYLVTRRRTKPFVVWVMAAPETLVTVFTIDQ